MPVSDRAKQFMPFSALKGLDEALRACCPQSGIIAGNGRRAGLQDASA